MPKPKNRNVPPRSGAPPAGGTLETVERVVSLFQETPSAERPVIEWIASLAFICVLARCDPMMTYAFALAVIVIHIAWSELRDLRSRRGKD